jgi:hypothetical protein
MIGLTSVFVAIVLGGAGAYFYYHQKRETIFVKGVDVRQFLVELK